MTDTEVGSETLRRAAALMRERAELASPGPWLDERGFCSGPLVRDTWDREVVEEWHASEEDTAHIASWHPVVALAMAAAFEQHAAQHGNTGRGECPWEDWACEVTTAARAYLGQSA